MKFTDRVTVSIALGLSCLCVVGCPGVLPDGIADATTPAPCTADADCGDAVACIFPNGTDQQGICDVDETQVSTGVPAPCNAADDCPDGIVCVFADGTDQDGFCDIDETQVE